MDLNLIAKEISNLDFSGVSYDETDEAIILLAKDLYNLNDDDANKILEIIENKYINNIE